MPNEKKIEEILTKLAQGEVVKESEKNIINEAIASEEKISVQLGKYVVNIGKAEGIHIGDRNYYSWNDEALKALINLIQFGDVAYDKVAYSESIRAKIREKQAYYQNKIEGLIYQEKQELQQLKSDYENNLIRIKADYKKNLRNIEIDHQNRRKQEINRLILDLTGRVNQLEPYLEELEENWSNANSGYPASSEVNNSYSELIIPLRKDLYTLRNDIEVLRQGKPDSLSASTRERISDFDQNFASYRAKLNYDTDRIKKELEFNKNKNKVAIQQNIATEIKKIEQNGRKEIYSFIIQFYLNKEGYPFSQKTIDELKQFQSELKMQKGEIETIEESEINPYYENNLQQYREEFTKIVTAEHYPVSDSSRRDLKQKQKSLGLKDKDIETFEQPIIDPYYQENLHEYEQKFTQIIKTEGYPVSHIARTQLEQKQKLLGLKYRDIEDSEQKISEPYCRENLHKYEQEFIELIKEEVTELTKESLDNLKSKYNSLKDRQKSLGLKSKDVKDSEQQIIKQYYQTSLDKYEREFTQLMNNQGYYLDDKINNNLSQRQQLLGIKILGFNSEDIVIVKRTIKNYQEKDKAIDYLSSNLFKEDYQKLRNSLASTKWKDANEETKNILFRLTKNRKKEHNRQDIKKITEEQIKTIDLLQIMIIDLLWDLYSKGRFSFHKQRDIFITAGKDYKAFSENIGWKKRSFFLLDLLSWKSDKDIVFNIDAPEGHLPFWRSYIINPEQFLLNLIDLNYQK